LRALVVFREGNHPLAFLMKKGFRHCFVCVENNGLWIKIDFCSGIPSVKYLTESDFDLAGYYRGNGVTVVETSRRESAVTCPVAVRNCVGMVKQILCINNMAITPYGLYKRLR